MVQLKKLPADFGPDYACVVADDGMTNAGICVGDVVYLKVCDHVKNGQIVAVKVGENIRFRKYRNTGDYTILTPANDEYIPTILTAQEMNSVEIIGRVVGCIRIYE